MIYLSYYYDFELQDSVGGKKIRFIDTEGPCQLVLLTRMVRVSLSYWHGWSVSAHLIDTETSVAIRPPKLLTPLKKPSTPKKNKKKPFFDTAERRYGRVNCHFPHSTNKKEGEAWESDNVFEKKRGNYKEKQENEFFWRRHLGLVERRRRRRRNIPSRPSPRFPKKKRINPQKKTAQNSS